MGSLQNTHEKLEAASGGDEVDNVSRRNFLDKALQAVGWTGVIGSFPATTLTIMYLGDKEAKEKLTLKQIRQEHFDDYKQRAHELGLSHVSYEQNPSRDIWSFSPPNRAGFEIDHNIAIAFLRASYSCVDYDPDNPSSRIEAEW